MSSSRALVGPVLQPGSAASAIIAAICELNPAATVSNQGGYVRVTAPQKCVVTRAAIESHLGSQFQLPGDLEASMPAFTGKLTISDTTAEWSYVEGAKP